MPQKPQSSVMFVTICTKLSYFLLISYLLPFLLYVDIILNKIYIVVLHIPYYIFVSIFMNHNTSMFIVLNLSVVDSYLIKPLF